jgi:hypothetical protein
MLTIKLSDKLTTELPDFFDCIYFCNKNWNAWQNEYMEREDFCYIYEDSNFLKAIYEIIKEDNINEEVVISYLNNFDAFYNGSLYYNFEPECFHEDWLDYINFDAFLKYLKKLKLVLNISNF